MMLNDLAAYLIDRGATNPALTRGGNFFVGYSPDLTALSTDGVILILKQVSGDFVPDLQSQSTATYLFKLQFLGQSFFETGRFAESLCADIRNVHGAQVPSTTSNHVYHCANLTVTSPVHLATDAKGRFAFVADLMFVCQRLAVEGT